MYLRPIKTEGFRNRSCYYNVKKGICEGRMMFFAFVLDFDAPRAYNFGVRSGIPTCLPKKKN